MHTEIRSILVRSGVPRKSALGRAVVLCILWLNLPVTARAVVPVGPETEVRAIEFTGVRSIPESELRRLLQTQGRVRFFRLRAALGKLPLVPGPPRFPFLPRVLQEDVVRLRHKYAAAGFLGTDVRYEVQRSDDDLLDIRFLIREGTPVMVTQATVVSGDSLAPLVVPVEEGKNWAKLERKVRRLAGHRLEAKKILAQQEDLQRWWLDRGFPRASVRGLVERDSSRSEARVLFAIDTGERARFGAIHVRGTDAISDHVVLRELPFEKGDLYSESAIARGRRNLQQLQIVRAARIEVGAAAPADSSESDPPSPEGSVLPVSVTIAAAKPRLLSGQLGYVTDAGISSEASWSHRNFRGGARILTLSALAQTGLLALTDDPDLRYRGVLSLQQPHVIHRRISAIVSPFVEYREDLRDRSLEVGSNFTLVYRPHQALTGSLDYRISSRKIYEYRVGDLAAGNVDLLTFLSQILQGELEGLGGHLGSSLVTVSMAANTLDEITNPHQGVFVRPSLQVTAPTGLSSASYWRADCTAHGFVPLSRRTTIVGRLAAGRLFPFGKSLPGSGESITESILELRDASFTAGGSSDVRGWGYRMLGPKFPDIRVVPEGDSLGLRAEGYVPIGGFSRVSFSLELDLPMPLLGSSFGSHVFLDGGRVWTQDSRFISGSDRYGQTGTFYATGAGVDLLTPVGAIKFSLGYKLNPSILDLVNAEDVLRALQEETPLDGLERHGSHRWQFHFAIGSSF